MLCCVEKDVLNNDQERRERFSDRYYAFRVAQSIDRTLLLSFLYELDDMDAIERRFISVKVIVLRFINTMRLVVVYKAY